jgi:protein-tyrosine-phosphatase
MLRAVYFCGEPEEALRLPDHVTVVFVCTGNTCRSPLAMALARRAWPSAVRVLSAGLQAMPGMPAAENARQAASERDADLTDHRSRPVDAGLVAEAGWLIGMTRSHVAQLNARLAGRDDVRVGMLGAPGVDLSGRATPDAEEVADPFGGDIDQYRAVADQIERLLAAWQDHLTGAAGAPSEEP